jgi:hypothetical protein
MSLGPLGFFSRIYKGHEIPEDCRGRRKSSFVFFRQPLPCSRRSLRGWPQKPNCRTTFTNTSFFSKLLRRIYGNSIYEATSRSSVRVTFDAIRADRIKDVPRCSITKCLVGTCCIVRMEIICLETYKTRITYYLLPRQWQDE